MSFFQRRSVYDVEQELIHGHIVPLPMAQRHPMLLLLADYERALRHEAYTLGFEAGKYEREQLEELARQEERDRQCTDHPTCQP